MKSRLLGAVCLYLSAYLALIPTTASAAIIVLDQFYNPTNSQVRNAAVADNISAAQTFTVGVSGVLSNIEVNVRKGTDTIEDLVLGIWSTNNSGLLLGELASFSMSPNDITTSNSFINFNVINAAIPVSFGEVFAISLSSAASNASPFLERYNWRIGRPGDPDYAGGSSFSCSTLATSCTPLDADLYFKTYVSTVPIPPAVWLFGSGLLGLIGVARRKQA